MRGIKKVERAAPLRPTSPLAAKHEARLAKRGRLGSGGTCAECKIGRRGGVRESDDVPLGVGRNMRGIKMAVGRATPFGVLSRTNMRGIKMARRLQRQLALPTPNGWGGVRAGAGRRPRPGRRPMPHELRPHHDGRCPVQVTLRAAAGVPTLRSPTTFAAVEGAIAKANKPGFRVLHFSVQQDHAHFIAEGDTHASLHSGIHALAIRIALAINRTTDRRGRLWGDRYHARALTTPREVRASMAYVLLNSRKHLRAPPGVDPFSSGPYFSGWQRPPLGRHGPAATAPPRSRPGLAATASRHGSVPTAPPSTWLGRVGWMRVGGPLRVDEGPAGSPLGAKVSARSRRPRA